MSDIKQELMLFVNQYNNELIMKKYNVQHKIETLNTYNTQFSNLEDGKHTLAKYIHNNYNTMDEKEMQTILMKCLNINKIKSLLLQYELENYEEIPQKCMSLSEFKNKARQIFARYQCRAGGFLIEDTQWTVHDSRSTRYDVKENELLFENTLNIVDLENDDVENYIYYIVKRLGSIAENIEVEIRQKVKHKMVYLLIWVNDNTIDDVIGL